MHGQQNIKKLYEMSAPALCSLFSVILVKSGPAKYAFYMDLESDCVTFCVTIIFLCVVATVA
jgi:hypothetical protein